MKYGILLWMSYINEPQSTIDVFRAFENYQYSCIDITRAMLELEKEHKIYMSSRTPLSANNDCSVRYSIK